MKTDYYGDTLFTKPCVGNANDIYEAYDRSLYLLDDNSIVRLDSTLQPLPNRIIVDINSNAWLEKIIKITHDTIVVQATEFLGKNFFIRLDTAVTFVEIIEVDFSYSRFISNSPMNGNYVAFNDFGYISISKVDNNYNPIWTKKLIAGGSVEFIRGDSIVNTRILFVYKICTSCKLFRL